MGERYYRAGYFPTAYRDQDMLWLDYRAIDATDAWWKARKWQDAHNGYDLLVVRELDRKARKKEPRKEPAEYGCDYDLENPKQKRFLPLFEVCAPVGCEDEPHRIFDALGFRGRDVQSMHVNKGVGTGSLRNLLACLNHSMALKGADLCGVIVDGLEARAGETLGEVERARVVAGDLLEEFGVFFGQFFHGANCTRTA